MLSLNRVFLAGNLARPPEVRYTETNKPVGNMTVAVNRRFRKQTGEVVSEVCFVDIVIWGKQAESCGKFLKKGSRVMIEGRLRQDRWENKEGQSRSRLIVVADRVQFLDRPEGMAEESLIESQESFEEVAEKEIIESDINGNVEDKEDELPF